MSGGHFDYKQYHLQDIIHSIEEVIEKNDEIYLYSNETIDAFKKGIALLERAGIFAQRIDWLVSGDDGEEMFHKRLKEELDFDDDDDETSVFF